MLESLTSNWFQTWKHDRPVFSPSLSEGELYTKNNKKIINNLRAGKNGLKKAKFGFYPSKTGKLFQI